MKTIAVYGSLKRGRYNHPMLESSKFLGNTTLKGTLYRVSSYPALVDDGENEYEAELYEVDDDTYSAVRVMELGAGYVEKEVDGAIVYVAGEALRKRCEESYQQIDSY